MATTTKASSTSRPSTLRRTMTMLTDFATGRLSVAYAVLFWWSFLTAAAAGVQLGWIWAGAALLLNLFAWLFLAYRAAT